MELLEGPAGASLSALPTVLMLEKKNVTGVVTVSCRTLIQLTASFQFGKSGVALGRSQVTEQTFSIYGGRWNIHVQIYEVSEEIPC